MLARLIASLVLLTWSGFSIGIVHAQQPLAPADVIDAMRSCLPITSVASVDEWKSRSGTRVQVEDAPRFGVTDIGTASGRPEKYTVTDQFYLWRDDFGPNAEYYAHVTDPKIILIFPRYRPAQEIAPQDWSRIREFRKRVLDCFDSSTGLTPNEAMAVRWYDAFYYLPPIEGSLPIKGFPKSIFVPPPGTSLLDGLYLREGGILSDPGQGLGYKVTFAPTSADAFGDLELGGTFGRQLKPLATGTQCAITGPGYCAFESPYVGGTKSTSEMFSGLSVGGKEAVVDHGTCCNGEGWTVTWYDADRDVTYSLTLYGSFAKQVGGSSIIDAANLPLAQGLADAAASFMPVDMGALRGRIPPRPAQ